jgi:tetratricopeptide (TPR) repeat protein
MPDLYAETEYPRAAGWTPLQALTDGRWIAIRAGAATEVYDLRSDPHELHDIAAGSSSIANGMRSRIDAIRAGGSMDRQSGSPGLSQEAEERLRALGYVTTGSASTAPANAPNPASQIEAWNQFEEAVAALQSRQAQALPMLERIARRHPESPVFQATAARALKEAGQLNQALAAYRSAVRRWPSDATLLHDLAVAAREAGQAASGPASRALHDEAVKAERAALAVAPGSALAHNGLGLLAVDEGQAQAAAAEFDRAAALDPNNASFLANLGNARRALGDRAGAEHAYRQAMTVSDRSADAANGLGVLLVEAHRPAEAVTWFERALSSAPDFAEARLNLGIALQESGQRARAVDEYRKVLGAPGAEHEKQAAAKLLATLGAGRSQ